MTKKHEAITLRVSPKQKESLQQICNNLDVRWGDKPNISKLIRAIADGWLVVSVAKRRNQKGSNV